MSPRCRRPPLVLALIFCWFLAQPLSAFPVGPSTSPPSDLEQSASGDDLISGSDFLSLFIGASMHARGNRARSASKAQNEPNQNLGAFGARLIPKPKTTEASPSTVSESRGRYDDYSDSRTPSVEIVSLPDGVKDTHSSATFVHTSHSGIEFRSKLNMPEPLGRSTSEYAPGDTETATTINQEKEDVTSENGTGVETDVKVITEVVTTRGELVPPTELTNNVPQDQDQEQEAEASIQYQVATEPKDHPVKASDFVSPTASSEEVEIRRSTEPTDEVDRLQPPPVQQVVSVRVSSSVVHGPSASPALARVRTPKPNDTTKQQYEDGLAQTLAAPASDEDMQRQTDARESIPSEAPALVTEEKPKVTAVQRSEFSVEESAPSSSELSSNPEAPTVFHKTIARVVEVSRNSQRSPVSYQTSVSSATSGSRVQFYSEPPSYHRSQSGSTAESVRTSVVTSHQEPPPTKLESSPSTVSSDSFSVESRVGRYGTPHHKIQMLGPRVTISSEVHTSQEKSLSVGREQKSFRHQEAPEQNYEVPERTYSQPERNYAQPERNYGEPERNYAQPERNYGRPSQMYARPEQNYEVDEAVSVMSNGRAHGVQPTTPSAQPTKDSALAVLDTPQSQDPNHKFGYVVEGRNFRKYRVEERTPDGFIVGEYGVVSHDDGSLRGVRYTADSTINPRLIYEALVKFLSL